MCRACHLTTIGAASGPGQPPAPHLSPASYQYMGWSVFLVIFVFGLDNKTYFKEITTIWKASTVEWKYEKTVEKYQS